MKKALMLLAVFIMGAVTTLGVSYAIYEITPQFPDVDYNAYYGNALIEMQERKVINGYENGNFGPNDPVTRAQMVAILDRYEDGLFSKYNTGRTKELLELICADLDEENLSEEMQESYERFCHPVVTL